MSSSNYLENWLITQLMTNKTVYIGYGTAGAGEDGSTMAEPSGNGYAREAYGAYTISGNEVTNDSSIAFNTATGNQGIISHFYYFDALTGGNYLGEQSLSAAGLPNITVVTGKSITIASGNAKLTSN